jgi:dihydrolipoamide dehydrogenase
MIYEQMQHAADFGVQASGIHLAFADVQKRKDKVVLKNSKGIEYLMKKNKVTVFKGTGQTRASRQSRNHRLRWKKADDRDKEHHHCYRFCCAADSGFETDGQHVVNSDHILELKDVPKSLIVMGAGAVGVEFASVYSRFRCRDDDCRVVAAARAVGRRGSIEGARTELSQTRDQVAGSIRSSINSRRLKPVCV